MPALVPELSVSDWRRSCAFYTGMLGFALCYARPEEGFCWLERDGAALMLDQLGVGRDFAPPPAHTFGRGVNLQIEIPDAETLAARLTAAGHALHLPLEDRWYRRDDHEVGNRQFVVADPDGYLLRFFSDLGRRARKTEGLPQGEP